MPTYTYHSRRTGHGPRRTRVPVDPVQHVRINWAPIVLFLWILATFVLLSFCFSGGGP